MQEGFEAEDDIGARDDYTREVDEEAAFQKAQVVTAALAIDSVACACCSAALLKVVYGLMHATTLLAADLLLLVHKQEEALAANRRANTSAAGAGASSSSAAPDAPAASESVHQNGHAGPTAAASAGMFAKPDSALALMRCHCWQEPPPFFWPGAVIKPTSVSVLLLLVMVLACSRAI